VRQVTTEVPFLALPRSHFANLTFPEFMHFKLIMGDEMHTRGGGGLARARVPEDPMLPNPGNIALLLPRLADQRVLWTGGGAAYRQSLQGRRIVP
jgi:hypothetical protein